MDCEFARFTISSAVVSKKSIYNFSILDRPITEKIPVFSSCLQPEMSRDLNLLALLIRVITDEDVMPLNKRSEIDSRELVRSVLAAKPTTKESLILCV